MEATIELNNRGNVLVRTCERYPFTVLALLYVSRAYCYGPRNHTGPMMSDNHEQPGNGYDRGPRLLTLQITTDAVSVIIRAVLFEPVLV